MSRPILRSGQRLTSDHILDTLHDKLGGSNAQTLSARLFEFSVAESQRKFLSLNSYHLSVGQWAYTNGKTAGGHRFTAPQTPGQYEFRYLLNDGYDAPRASA
jgi:hypothetical protein